MSRAILLAALALSTFGCVRSSPTNSTGSGGPTSPSSPTAPSGPNFTGNWSGDYVILDCRQSGEVSRSNICGAVGHSGLYTISMTQSGLNVTATYNLGGIQYPTIAGKVNPDGSLPLSAITISNDLRVNGALTLNLSGTTLGGSVSQFWTSTTLTGKTTTSGRINTSVRAAFASPPLPLARPQSLSDFARAVEGPWRPRPLTSEASTVTPGL